jgi:isopentenyl-diphosphate delta-isomerase
MAVGSQRIAIINPRTAPTFRVRDIAPGILLFANMGAVQLNYGFDIDECQRAVEMIRADALVLHLNPLQEAIQPEGDTNFENLLPKIEKVVKRLSVPVVVKEVGFGMSQDVAGRLCSVGVKAIDTAGWGGTNWAKIEGFRRARVEGQSRLGDLFCEWGIPTSESIVQCRKVKGINVIGSGGIRNGIEIAKAIVLGADLVGMALPFLRPAMESTGAVEENLRRLIRELKVTMFCTGSQSIHQLKSAPLEKIE